MKEIDDSWYIKPEGITEFDAAGGVVVRTEEKNILVGLITEGDEDLYVLPKGHVEKGEKFEQAARREIEEEAGISDLRLLKVFPVIEGLNHRKTQWRRAHYFLFQTNQIKGRPTDRNKVYSGVEWFDINELPEFFWPDQKKLIEDNREVIRNFLAALEK